MILIRICKKGQNKARSAISPPLLPLNSGAHGYSSDLSDSLSTHSRDKQEWTPTTPGFDPSNTWHNLSASLYLEWEVRTDEEEDRQLAPSPGVVARPGFVAWAGDRRLLTGGASPVRIFCRLD